MRLIRSLPVIALTLCGLAPARSGTASPSAPAPALDRADFSGIWRLNEEKSTRVADLLTKDGAVPDGGAAGSRGERAGRRGGARGGSSGGSDLGEAAYQLLEDERRLVVADEGETVRITRTLGKKRVLYPDGEERELDDGDGPAAVTAKRKGARGERIVVSSKWPTGRGMSETWELLSNPRRLLVTTKVSSRRSFTVKRVYDPAPDGPPEAVPAAAPAAPQVPTVVPLAEPVAPVAPAVSPAGMAKCSVHPARGATGEELTRLANVSQAAAERRVLDFVAPKKPTSIITSDVEVYEGCLVWTFVLRFADTKGVQEIAIDAGDGKVLTSEIEVAGAEKP
ncbi:MAG TPA: hypothetical protein VF580_01135 [Thermoanaerobaculia bacterium]